MLLDPRILILFGANALLLHLSLMVNSALANWPIYLVLLGPMVVLPALYLHRSAFFICTLLTGLWIDAALPAPFGLFTLGLLAVGTWILLLRLRFRAEQNLHPVLLAHAVNLVALLLLVFGAGHGSFDRAAFWIQAALTALASHLALLVVAPWFFNLARLLFELCHVETEPEDLPFV